MNGLATGAKRQRPLPGPGPARAVQGAGVLLALLLAFPARATPVAPGGPGDPAQLRLRYLERQLWEEEGPPRRAPTTRPTDGAPRFGPDAAPPHLRPSLLTAPDSASAPPREEELSASELLPTADLDRAAALQPVTGTDPWPAAVFQPGGYDLPVTTNRLVIQYLRLFLGRGRSTFARYLARSGRFADHILASARAYGLPRDLLYVAMIESGFQVKAVSAAAAAGVWQFVRPTAEAYGLRVDGWVDERFDPVRATDAALRHLRDLHDLYGSWELALAAYNGGIGRIGAAIARYNSNDFWTLARYDYLPLETAHYVAKATAAMILGHHRELFGFGAVQPEPPPATREIRGAPGLRLATVAQRIGVRERELAELNPWLLRGALPSSGRLPRLVVPAKAPKLGAADDPLPELPSPPGPPFTPHVVQLGETLSELARTYNVSATTLEEVNQLQAEDDLLPGQQLLIPLAAATPGHAPGPAGRRIVVVPPVQFDYPDRQKVFFAVPRRGMDLRAIATTFGVRVEEVLLWNELDEEAHLWPGMVLRLFVPKKQPLPRARILPASSVEEVVVESRRFGEEMRRLTPAWKIPRRWSRRYAYHRVSSGETLLGIAARYKVTPEAVARANSLRADELLEGQVLRIPRTAKGKPRAGGKPPVKPRR